MVATTFALSPISTRKIRSSAWNFITAAARNKPPPGTIHVGQRCPARVVGFHARAHHHKIADLRRVSFVSSASRWRHWAGNHQHAIHAAIYQYVSILLLAFTYIITVHYVTGRLAIFRRGHDSERMRGEHSHTVVDNFLRAQRVCQRVVLPQPNRVVLYVYERNTTHVGVVAWMPGSCAATRCRSLINTIEKHIKVHGSWYLGSYGSVSGMLCVVIM